MKDFFYNNLKDYEILVNKDNPLSKYYIPNNLTKINAKYSNGKQYMCNIAKDYFEEMARDAKNKGFNIYAVSTYRSYDYQNNLFNNYVKDKGFEYADRCCAKAGYSEHQTGLAVDIADSSLDYDNFDKTKEFLWIKDNAHNYGFILRYPKEKENITGYKYEPWHYRYIGKNAKYLYDNKLAFEEYKNNR